MKQIVCVFILFPLFCRAQSTGSDSLTGNADSFYSQTVQLYISPDYFLSEIFGNQDWKRQTSFSGGAQIYFSATPRWSFSTGIIYRQIRYAYETPPGSYTTRYDAFREDYFGIPFNVMYAVTSSKKKLRLYTTAGISLNNLFRESRKIEYTYANGTSSSSGYLRTWPESPPNLFFSFNMGIGTLFKVSKRMNIFAQPGALFSVNVLNNSYFSPIGEKRNSIYCNLGANYSFGKIKTKQLIHEEKKNGKNINVLIFAAGGVAGNIGKKVTPVRYVSGVNFMSWSYRARDIEETPSYYVGAGVGFIFPMGSKMGIRTGLEIETFRYDGLITSYDVTVVNYSNASNIVTTHSVQPANDSYYFIERCFVLPVSAVYSFRNEKKLSYGVELGAEVNFTETQRSGLLEMDEHRTDFYSMAGYFFKLRMRENLTLFMEPMLKLQPYIAHKGRVLWNASLRMGVIF